MRNPLIKRLPRELKSEFPKYLVIFLFMIMVIGFVSGMSVASGSLMKCYTESFDKCNVEDGNFELAIKADETLISSLEESDIKLYENFYIEKDTKEVDSVLRVYKNRKDINLVSIMKGEMPSENNEIAIDRMYADNNNLKVGDTLTVGDKAFTISGLVAFSDYSALYRSPSDMMFDAIKFGVAVTTEEGFDSLGEAGLHYNYSWLYDTAPEDDIKAKEMSEELLESIAEKAPVTSFIPAFSNQAMQFVGDDTGKDRIMFIVFLYIVVGIVAFIMAITTSNTIAREATVIGTLRASGYKRSEIILHYLAIPTFVTFVSAVIGNILGYTVFKDYALSIYYTNYSLPLFDIMWNADAFISTTIIPVILMFIINFFILKRKLSLSPLKFIRRDLKKNSKKKAVKLNKKIGFMHRFRLRIILQNIPNYVTIVIGIFLANIIILLGLGFPKLLDNSSKLISESLICNYQYILKAPAETKCEGAEKYCAGSLITDFEGRKKESVTIYGLSPDSAYIDIGGEDEICVSSAFSEKYGVGKGDTVTLKEEFGEKKYTFTITGIIDAPVTIAMYMSRDIFCDSFDYEEGYYNGYLSDNRITDIDEMLIAATITEDDMNKMSRQLTRSMGGVMDIFAVFGIVMFMLIVYLLSKIIIEKNSRSISMTKILGYSNKEISGLYIVSTSIVVVASFIVTMPIVDILMRYVCIVMFSEFSGWMPYVVPFYIYPMIIGLGIAAYGIIAFLQYRKVKKVPLAEALKNVE